METKSLAEQAGLLPANQGSTAAPQEKILALTVRMLAYAQDRIQTRKDSGGRSEVTLGSHAWLAEAATQSEAYVNAVFELRRLGYSVDRSVGFNTVTTTVRW